ncbi:bacteriocin fulvocin C-related protein [Nonomuraea sp. NPDC049400]|uniref:bacteriocin fulvocin C-related protein n=1 Tax=Nonomuraea sp. NPDC049400 TaxID=3364352 RepID=UPI0037AB001B
MASKPATWVLAFNESCSRCRTIAEKVKQSSGDKLDIRPLAHPEIQEWRTEALGEHAPWAPTLIKVGPHGVQAWTGAAMALRLLARLGPRVTWSVLAALGESRGNPADSDANKSQMGRGQFLRLAGLGIAAGVLFGKASPAQADPGGLSPAQQWAKDNKDHLPSTYRVFSAHDMPHRKAIYAELPPSKKGSLWREHLESYRHNHAGLTAQQHQAIDQALQVVRDESTFADVGTAAVQKRIEDVKAIVLSAFGRDEAALLIATLGPPVSSTLLARDCDCSAFDDMCWGSTCYLGGCTRSYAGCGSFWLQFCDGLCR